MRLSTQNIKALQGAAEELHDQLLHSGKCLISDDYQAFFLLRLLKVSDLLNRGNDSITDNILFNAILELTYASLALTHAMAKAITDSHKQ